jgi:hypothetical protein
MFSSTSMADLRHGIDGYRRYRDIMPLDILFSTENAVAVLIKCLLSWNQPCQVSADVNCVNSIVTVKHTFKISRVIELMSH